MRRNCTIVAATLGLVALGVAAPALAQVPVVTPNAPAGGVAVTAPGGGAAASPSTTPAPATPTDPRRTPLTEDRFRAPSDNRFDVPPDERRSRARSQQLNGLQQANPNLDLNTGAALPGTELNTPPATMPSTGSTPGGSTGINTPPATVPSTGSSTAGSTGINTPPLVVPSTR